MDEGRLTAVLAEFAHTLTMDFSIQKILDHLADRVVELIAVDGAGVLLMASETDHHFVAASDDVILGIEALQLQMQEGPCLRAYQTGHYVAIRDLSKDTTFARFSPAAAQAGLGAVYSFPLRLDDGQLGALELYAKEPVDLSEADLAGAQILADVTAAYLANAQGREAARVLARTSSELAATLQESMLPPELPVVPGLTTAAHLLPARGGTLVAGDFYDIFPLPGKRWGVLVGDVVGHGARAATLAASARYTARTLAVLKPSPRDVLAGLSDAVLSRADPEQFLSAVYLTTRRSPHGVEVKLSSGGHPAPLLRRADGSVQPVEAPGALLGCLRDPGLRDVRFRLNPQDVLVIYTDGVTEARRGQVQFGEDRLRSLLSAANPDPQAIVDGVARAVRTYCADEPADDVTIVALRAS